VKYPFDVHCGSFQVLQSRLTHRVRPGRGAIAVPPAFANVLDPLAGLSAWRATETGSRCAEHALRAQ
jgi:hypothetical protein